MSKHNDESRELNTLKNIECEIKKIALVVERIANSLGQKGKAVKLVVTFGKPELQ